MCAQHPAETCRMRDCHEHGQTLLPRDRPEWPHVPLKPTK